MGIFITTTISSTQGYVKREVPPGWVQLGNHLVGFVDELPTEGDFRYGDTTFDTDGRRYTCIEDGNPGVWALANTTASTPFSTLGELNALLTGATLIDTMDVRLSDARTPTPHNHPASEVTGLATVATSGAYSDLSGTPSLGSAADNDEADFATAAQGTVADSALQPTDVDTLSKVNALVGDATLIDTTDPRLSDARAPLAHTHSAGDVTSGLATVATSGAYADLSGTPSLGSAAAADTSDFATSAQGALADSAIQAGDLETVATSGDYSDLSGTPNLGTAALSDDTDFATAAQGALADSAVQPGDLDTLAELNSALTDATLIDTTDSRLSDARTPTAHTHVGADVTDLATVATTGAYSDLSGTPSLGTAADNDEGDFATAAQGSLADTAVQPGDIDTLAEVNAIITDATLIDTADSRLSDARTPLAHTHVGAEVTDLSTVATSGDYADLINQPQKLVYHSFSGRWYCYTDNRWVGFNNTYGPTYYQYAQNQGTGATPNNTWNKNGIILPAGAIPRRLWIKGRNNNIEVTSMNVYVRVNDAAFDNLGLAIDSSGESGEVVLANTNINTSGTAGNSLDMRLFEIDLTAITEHTMVNHGDIKLAMQPVGTITANRYFYCTYLFEIEMP